jgi:hypothetical protein
MSYTFDLIGVTPILSFFNYQQQIETSPRRSKAYLGSYDCTIDGFIRSTELIPDRPEWDWDKVVETMVNFWFKHESKIRYWQKELESLGQDNLIIARVANVEILRQEFEHLLQE